MDNKRKEAQRQREEARRQRRIEKEKDALAGTITIKQMRLMALALILRALPAERGKTIISSFSDGDIQLILHYMKMANLETQIDGDILLNCLKEMKNYIPVYQKLTPDNLLGTLLKIYRCNSRDKIEKIIRNERPLVKRFISQAYDGEYSGLPIKVADIVAHYVEDSV